MHKMKMIMEKLEEYVWEELEKDKEEICAKELAEIIDSIKDCTETMYYYTLTLKTGIIKKKILKHILNIYLKK